MDRRDWGLDHVVNERASLPDVNEWMLPGLLDAAVREWEDRNRALLDDYHRRGLASRTSFKLTSFKFTEFLTLDLGERASNDRGLGARRFQSQSLLGAGRGTVA